MTTRLTTTSVNLEAATTRVDETVVIPLIFNGAPTLPSELVSILPHYAFTRSD